MAETYGAAEDAQLPHTPTLPALIDLEAEDQAKTNELENFWTFGTSNSHLL